MSNLVSEMVYSRRIGSPVRKAVLVYFAARASDDGRGVWASKPTIAEAIECGRSTVIRTINDFVAEGVLREVGRRPCRGGSTTEYAMNLGVISALPSVDDDAPTTETSPAAGPVPERDPSQTGTPPVPQRDPHPSRSGTQTIIGTTIEPSNKSKAREALCSVLSEDVADAYIAHRRAKRAILTDHAAALIAKKLAGCPDPDAVVNDSIANGWTGVFPEKSKPPPRPTTDLDAAFAQFGLPPMRTTQ